MLPNGVMNAEDVARYLHLGKNTVYQLAKEGKLASYHVGRKLRFSLEDVEAYVASTRHAPTHVQGKEPVAGTQDRSSQTLSQAASFGMLKGETFAIAGGDPIADLISSGLNEQGVLTKRLVRGSYTALVNLYAGDADAAVVRLYDQKSNSYNIPYVCGLAPGASVIVFRLYGIEQGLIVKKGNPKGITTWGGLLRDGVTLANRVKGSSARVLLDEKLRALEARSEAIIGYDAHESIASVAVSRVAGGLADVTVGCKRDAAREPGVEFIGLQHGWVDLAVSKTFHTRSTIKEVKSLLSSPAFADACAQLRPCDMSKLGVVIYES